MINASTKLSVRFIKNRTDFFKQIRLCDCDPDLVYFYDIDYGMSCDDNELGYYPISQRHGNSHIGISRYTNLTNPYNRAISEYHKTDYAPSLETRANMDVNYPFSFHFMVYTGGESW